jgi:hypothetical protein
MKESICIALGFGLSIILVIVILMIEDWKWQRYKNSEKYREELRQFVMSVKEDQKKGDYFSWLFK